MGASRGGGGRCARRHRAARAARRRRRDGEDRAGRGARRRGGRRGAAGHRGPRGDAAVRAPRDRAASAPARAAARHRRLRRPAPAARAGPARTRRPARRPRPRRPGRGGALRVACHRRAGAARCPARRPAPLRRGALDVLAGLARPLTELPVVVVAAYRSDETPRGHPLRRLRDELRRQGELQEVAVGPLERDATAALTYRRLGEAPSPALARIVHDRTQGVPFFVEELCAVLREGDRVQPGKRGVDLAGEADVPVPETIRDAVLLRTASLSEDARAAADVAAVSGPRFDAVVVAELAGEEAVEELLASGLLVEGEQGTAAFRHALVRDALYADVPWLRRRSLHRALAEALEARGAGAAEVAAHWLPAREGERAPRDPLRAAGGVRAPVALPRAAP